MLHSGSDVHPDAGLIASLSGKLDAVLGEAIPARAPVALFDIPVHTNVGDHAITLGELTALKRLRHRLVHASAGDADPRAALAGQPADTVVLLHGGGNLGDFWPVHQRYRERVLDELHGHKVVQLPQSIWFESPESIEQAKRSFDAHPDFTLLVRDHESLAFARRHFTCRSELCPDSAFALGPLARPAAAREDVLCLARIDHERTDEGLPVAAVDWPRPLDRAEELLRRAAVGGSARTSGDLGRVPGAQPAVNLAFERLARRRVKTGLRTLARGRVVVTDRLHAHILSLLLGLPHVVADTRSGKVHGYMEAWTAPSRLARRAGSLPEALEIAQENA